MNVIFQSWRRVHPSLRTGRILEVAIIVIVCGRLTEFQDSCPRSSLDLLATPQIKCWWTSYMSILYSRNGSDWRSYGLFLRVSVAYRLPWCDQTDPGSSYLISENQSVDIQKNTSYSHKSQFDPFLWTRKELWSWSLSTLQVPESVCIRFVPKE